MRADRDLFHLNIRVFIGESKVRKTGNRRPDDPVGHGSGSDIIRGFNMIGAGRLELGFRTLPARAGHDKNIRIQLPGSKRQKNVVGIFTQMPG